MPEKEKVQEEEMTLDSLYEKHGSLDTTLVGVDGNAYAIMGHFQKNARRSGWSKEEIDFVLDRAKEGRYDHLVGVISRFTD